MINGSEKVLIAQERMAANHVYVFSKSAPSPVNFLAEIRSAVEKGGKTISSMQIKMMSKGSERSVSRSSRSSYRRLIVFRPCRADQRFKLRCRTFETTFRSS